MTEMPKILYCFFVSRISRIPLHMKSILLIIIAVMITLTIPGRLAAQITVDNVIVHLAVGARPVHNVIVSNGADQTAYVTVEVAEVVDPAKDAGHTEPTKDLLASPKAFSVEANGQRTVRLLLKAKPGEKERVFRVSFIPQDRGFGEEYRRSVAGRNTVIRVLTGMGILVFADPKEPKVNLSWEREGGRIKIFNSGTSHVYLGNGKSCTPENVCTDIPSKRLYAQSEYIISTPDKNTVSFLKEERASGDYQKLTIDPKG